MRYLNKQPNIIRKYLYEALYIIYTYKHEEIDDLAKRYSLLTKYEGDMWLFGPLHTNIEHDFELQRLFLVWCNIEHIEIRGAARSNDSIALIKLPCLYMSCKWPISPDLNSQVGDPDSILSEKKFQLLLFRERGKFPRLKNVKIIQRITIKHRKYLNSLATNAIIEIVFKKICLYIWSSSHDL